jgi:hypothetical protein
VVAIARFAPRANQIPRISHLTGRKAVLRYIV